MGLHWPLNSLASLCAFFSSVLAQAPVSDLTQYPSGLASIAVIAYYAIQSEKDDLPSRRRLAGMGVEHMARDQAVGPKEITARDLHIDTICLNRRANKYQYESWNLRTCGRKKGGLLYNNLSDNRAPLIDGRKLLDACAPAFADLPQDLRKALSKGYGFGTAGHAVAALAAFCQIAEAIPEARDSLKACATDKADIAKMLENYHDLRSIMDTKSRVVSMPNLHGKSMTDLETLFVGAHTWEGGGREVFAPCNVFVRALGYFVGYSYGEILVSCHRHLTDAGWASSVQITFAHGLDVSTPEDELIVEASRAVKASRFYKQECDLRLWFHRFGDSMASLVAGCIIAALVSLGSTSGSWVAVTAAAVADPRPVGGYTSAAWGYPRGRRAHMEAHADDNQGIVAIKRQAIWQSFQPHVLHDILWQLLVGGLSVSILASKFDIRDALGFGPFQPITEWIARLCLTAGALAVLIDLQIPFWAWRRGSPWALLHALVMVLLEIALLAPRFIWHDLSENTTVRHFWFADASAWIHTLLSGLFSIHLGQTSEYPVTGYIWPSAWLAAFASCGAGYPRKLPPAQTNSLIADLLSCGPSGVSRSCT